MKWFFNRGPRSKLALALTSYPPYCEPYSRNHHELNEAQAKENFAYFVDQKTTRLSVVADFLATQGIKIASVLDEGEDPKQVLDSLFFWAQENWPPLIDKSLSRVEAWHLWQSSDRQDAEIIFSLAMDVAITIGEMVILKRPQYQWNVDFEPFKKGDHMPSARRVVLTAPSVLVPGTNAIVDWELIVAERAIRRTTEPLNDWYRAYQSCVSGGYEGVGV